MNSEFSPGDKVRHVRIHSGTGRIVGPHPDDPDTWFVILDGHDEHGRREGWFANCLELIPEPRKVAGWVNVYEHYKPTFHTTQKDADKYPLIDDMPQVKRTHCIYVSGSEGAGPDDADV